MMTTRQCLTLTALTIAAFVAIVPGSEARAQGNALAKIYIRADSVESGGQKFADQKREDTVKDMKKRAGKFQVVETEAEAEYLLVVVERTERTIAGQPSSKVIAVTISERDGSSWKPRVRLEKLHSAWSLGAGKLMGDAQDWVRDQKKNAKK